MFRPSRRLPREGAVDRRSLLQRAGEELVEPLPRAEESGQLHVDTARLARIARPFVGRARRTREHQRQLTAARRHVHHAVESDRTSGIDVERAGETRLAHQHAQLPGDFGNVAQRDAHFAQLAVGRKLQLLRNENALAAHSGRRRRNCGALLDGERRRRGATARGEEHQEERADRHRHERRALRQPPAALPRM